jgi:hypothetical protein
MISRSVVFVDTSILLNILDVPRMNAERIKVVDDYKKRVGGASLVLPITTVIETGNHICQIPDGGARRACAERFVGMLELVIAGRSPFVLHEAAWDGAFLSGLVQGGSTGVLLVDHLTHGRLGCGDLAILVERDRYLARVAKGVSAVVWTLDRGLSSHA